MTKSKLRFIALLSVCVFLFSFLLTIDYEILGNGELTGDQDLFLERMNENILEEMGQIKTAGIIVYEQDFNDEIPADNEGDGVYRIPTGWTAPDPGIFPGGNYCYPTTSAPSAPINTVNLAIGDAQAGSFTYIERPLPAVTAGSFEFIYYMRGPTSAKIQHNLILESSTGTDLITFTSLKAASSSIWGISLESTDAGQFYTIYQDYINVKINFNGTTADLIVNGTEVLSDITYSAGTIENIRITTGPLVSSCLDGLGHYDDMVLIDENSFEKPAAPVLNSIPSPDSDGTYTVSWNLVSGATRYQLYRSTSLIVNIGGLTPIYNDTGISYLESSLPKDIYYYCVVASNSSGTSPLSNNVNVEVLYPIVETNEIVYEQNFNDEIPADNEGDGVYRIPTGWTAPNPGIFPGGIYCYPTTSAPVEPINTVNLAIGDAQAGSFTYIERPLPAVTAGSFEFIYYMRGPTSAKIQHNLILESSTGTDLITFTSLKAASSSIWGISLESTDAGQFYTIYQDYINVKINFNGTTADLIVNGTEILSDIAYSAGTIENIRITTGPLVSSCLDGLGHYDNMILTSGLLIEKPAAPVLNSIPSPDSDGNYTISWSSVSSANSYQLFRSLTSIVDIGVLYPLYSGFETSYTDNIEEDGVYYYCVQALNNSGASPLSNEISIEVIFPIILETPVLNEVESPDFDGIFALSWQSIEGVSVYNLYKNESIITDIEGLVPIYSGPEISYAENIEEDGIYYYRVQALNDSGASPLSNEISVEVIITPILEIPVLDEVESPDSDGTFTISWQPIEGASIYDLYRTDSIITDIENFDPIYSGQDTIYNEENLEEGLYYYIVVARNDNVSSDPSNVVIVEVEYEEDTEPPDDSIPGYSGFISFTILGIFVVLLLERKRKHI